MTDFGEYFTYFSFFLVVSALLLASLFFRLGVEQRLREIGALRALGFDERGVRRLFWAESAALSLAGGLLGAAGAVGYAELIMWGLRTWWVDAVGTTLLALHVSPPALAAGIGGGMAAAGVSIAWSLRMVARATPRALIHGVLPSGPSTPRGAEGAPPPRAAAARQAPVVLGLLGAAVLAVTLAGILGDTAGFFGAGMLLLASLLTLAWTWLGRQAPAGAAAPPTWTVSRVGLRNTTARPGRSVLCITLIAFASFIIVAVDAFHLEGGGSAADRSSGTGGYPLLAESLLPIVRDLGSEESREELGVSSFDDEVFTGVSYARFRLRPGEDTSCLNLYQAKDPRVLAPEAAFLAEGRFRFGATLAETEAEAANPWLLLDRVFDDGAVPAIADATSLAYALHLSVGDDFVLNRDSGNPVRLRIVAALSDSIFQRELIVGEPDFMRLFPERDGYRFFLIDAPADGTAEAAAALEDRLSDYGFDVTSAPERLAAFHRGQQHVPRHVPDSRRPRPAAGDPGPGGGAAEERAGAAARAGPAAGRRLRHAARLVDGAGRERPAAVRRPRHRDGLRGGGDRPRLDRAGRPVPGRLAGRGCCSRWRRPVLLPPSPPPPPRSGRRCWRRCGPSRGRSVRYALERPVERRPGRRW